MRGGGLTAFIRSSSRLIQRECRRRVNRVEAGLCFPHDTPGYFVVILDTDYLADG